VSPPQYSLRAKRIGKSLGLLTFVHFVHYRGMTVCKLNNALKTFLIWRPRTLCWRLKVTGNVPIDELTPLVRMKKSVNTSREFLDRKNTSLLEKEAQAKISHKFKIMFIFVLFSNFTDSHVY